MAQLAKDVAVSPTLWDAYPIPLTVNINSGFLGSGSNLPLSLATVSYTHLTLPTMLWV